MPWNASTWRLFPQDCSNCLNAGCIPGLLGGLAVGVTNKLMFRVAFCRHFFQTSSIETMPASLHEQTSMSNWSDVYYACQKAALYGEVLHYVVYSPGSKLRPKGPDAPLEPTSIAASTHFHCNKCGNNMEQRMRGPDFRISTPGRPDEFELNSSWSREVQSAAWPVLYGPGCRTQLKWQTHSIQNACTFSAKASSIVKKNGEITRFHQCNSFKSKTQVLEVCTLPEPDSSILSFVANKLFKTLAAVNQDASIPAYWITWVCNKGRAFMIFRNI